MRQLDLLTMTAADVAAEAARRLQRRAAGLPLHDEAGEAVSEMHATLDVAGVPTSLIIELPWSSLVSDNAKYVPVLRVRAGRSRAAVMLSPAYRKGKAAIQQVVRTYLDEMRLPPPVFPRHVAVHLEATLHEPNRHVGRDPANFCKLVQDALEHLVYVKDVQIDASCWLRGSVDVDRPRLMVHIRRQGALWAR